MLTVLFVIEANRKQSSSHWGRVWQHLWELRDVLPVSVVLPTVVRSPCPLLAEEKADMVCASTGMHVPGGSAWVPSQVDLSRYVRGNGDVHLQALEKMLVRCVDSGDELHRTGSWPSASLQYDSWLNRRLAVSIRGWGTLVDLRGDDPRQFRTLCELQDLATFVAEVLRKRSRDLARDHGRCPAIDVAGERLKQSGSEMQARWQRAVDDTAIRHRNLTMMSPWDVFPARRPADLRYVDLLPLICNANSLSFRRDVAIDHWNVNEFRRFYERVSAILCAGDNAGLIAKQV